MFFKAACAPQFGSQQCCPSSEEELSMAEGPSSCSRCSRNLGIGDWRPLCHGEDQDVSSWKEARDKCDIFTVIFEAYLVIFVYFKLFHIFLL